MRNPANGRMWLAKIGINPTKHFYRKCHGWGVNAEHLAALRAAGYGVVLQTMDGVYYHATVAAFGQHAIPICYGAELEHVLPIRYWIISSRR